MRPIQRRTCAVAVAACAALGVGSLGTTAHAATLLAQYSVANYNATTGVWTDSVGGAHNATSAGATMPTLVTSVTPNGSSAVHFDGTQYLSMATGVQATNPIAVFAYVSADSAGASTTINRGIVGSPRDLGGSFASGFSYSLKIAADSTFKQQMGRVSQPAVAVSPNSHPADTFANIDWAGNSAGSFRYNGADDGATSGAFFDSSTIYPINVIGKASAMSAVNPTTDMFFGNIAEIRIYTGAMTAADRQAVEDELNLAYGTPVPEPTSLAVLAVGGLMLGARRRRAQ